VLPAPRRVRWTDHGLDKARLLGIAAYDHPDDLDTTTARVITLWRRR
jgi:hypothetical protein